jgi:hypothetical protein
MTMETCISAQDGASSILLYSCVSNLHSSLFPLHLARRATHTSRNLNDPYNKILSSQMREFASKRCSSVRETYGASSTNSVQLSGAQQRRIVRLPNVGCLLLSSLYHTEPSHSGMVGAAGVLNLRPAASGMH